MFVNTTTQVYFPQQFFFTILHVAHCCAWLMVSAQVLFSITLRIFYVPITLFQLLPPSARSSILLDTSCITLYFPDRHLHVVTFSTLIGAL